MPICTDCARTRRWRWESLPLFRLGLLALAFGYIEAAVAHDLRLLFSTPAGQAAAHHALLVEAGREAATLLLLAAAASLAARAAALRLVAFAWAFAIWDLCYYASLRLFEGWPASLWDWDLLFLLPAPWLGPVWAPLAISLACVAAGLHANRLVRRHGSLRVPRATAALLTGAAVCAETSFLSYSGDAARLPQTYAWPWLLLGAVFACTSWYRVVRTTRAAGDFSAGP